MHVLSSRQKAFPFGEGVGISDGRGYCLPFRGRCRLCRRKRILPSLSGKVSALPTEEVCTVESIPLGGVYLSFGLNWEECRHRETLLLTEIQNGKEGLP